MNSISLVTKTIQLQTGLPVVRGELTIERQFAWDLLRWKKNTCVADGFLDLDLLIECVKTLNLDLVCIQSKENSNNDSNLSMDLTDIPRITDEGLFVFWVINGSFQTAMHRQGATPFFMNIADSSYKISDELMRISDQVVSEIERAAIEGAHGIIIADDIASRTNTLVSPGFLERHLLPVWKNQVAAAGYMGVPILFHSDGNINSALPVIAEAGFDGLQSIEPSAGMDIKEIKAEYGKKFCLMGNLDTSLLTEPGNPGSMEVKLNRLTRSINELISSTGNGSGFIFGTCSGLHTGMLPELVYFMYRHLFDSYINPEQNSDSMRVMKSDQVICLTLLPIDKTVEVKSGSNLLESIRRTGIEISSPCNGYQLCGKCKIRIHPSKAAPDANHSHLTPEELASGYRLACQSMITEDMKVILPKYYSLDTRILEGEQIRSNPILPAVKINGVDHPFHLLYHNRPPEILNDWHKDFSPKGIAVDLGTTTLVVTLMDLLTGDELATASGVNPQIRFGHDVMSRIHRASTPDGLKELYVIISDRINELIKKICNKSLSYPDEIVDAVIGGNTPMLQIAASMDPSPLGKVPFQVDIQGGRTYRVQTFGLDINPQARVYIPSVVHAFIGSDISAGLLSTDFFVKSEPTLFIDMGTNGEMALAANGRITVTSTAIGPALEGMNISCGMRAVSGAIEMVTVSDQFINLKTIDDESAKGICGSGILDMMACLIRQKIVGFEGRLEHPDNNNPNSGPFQDRFENVNGIPAIKLANNVYLTQKDIRQIQLANSAIRTGMEMLLTVAGLELDQLEAIIIAGAFGFHLREESLRQLSIIPQVFNGKLIFAGNTSRTGCALMLTDVSRRDFLCDAIKEVKYLSIAEETDFQSRFIKNLTFPDL